MIFEFTKNVSSILYNKGMCVTGWIFHQMVASFFLETFGNKDLYFNIRKYNYDKYIHIYVSFLSCII